MPQTLQIIIKSAIFDRDRLLTIKPAYIEFDDKELAFAAPVRFVKKDIASFRHGVKKMHGFIAGNIYCIDICNTEDVVIEIRLKSIHGMREGEMAEKYAAILNGLYDNYFDDVSRGYLKQFESGTEFNILDIQFGRQGVFLNEQPGLLPWKDIEVKVDYTHYAICSMQDGKTYRVIDSSAVWNAGVLYSVLIQLLKYHKLLLAKKAGRLLAP